MSYRLCTSDISSKVLPHDDDYRALTHGEDESSENKYAPDDENGNKIKIQEKLKERRDNNDLEVLGNDSEKHEDIMNQKATHNQECQTKVRFKNERRETFKSICILSCNISITISFRIYGTKCRTNLFRKLINRFRWN